MLSVGPCDVDPKRHLALRIAHWELEGDEAKQFGDSYELDAVVLSADPIVLWTSENWPETLGFWWTLDTLARLKPAPLPLEPARVWRPWEPAGPGWPGHGFPDGDPRSATVPLPVLIPGSLDDVLGPGPAGDP